MARYGKQRVLGRVVLLILLIIALVIGGALWFDYLGFIDIKRELAPVLRLFGYDSRTHIALKAGETLSLDEERLAHRLEALELRATELDIYEENLEKRENELIHMANELEERQKALEEQEKSFNKSVKQFEDRRVNVEQNAQYLIGMPPERAVDILIAMDDQDIIDVFRMTEELAQAEGTSSMVAYWLSLFPSERAAELQRKMANKPASLY